MGPVGEVIELPLLLPEALHHAHAGDGLVADSRHFGRLLLGVPAGGEDAVAHAQGDHEEEGDDGQCHHGEQRREDHHDDKGHDEHHQVAADDR